MRPRMAGQRHLCRLHCSHGGARTSEADEEGVAVGAHLNAAEPGPDLAKEPMMIVEHLAIAIAELVQELCRPLDVGEHQRHAPGRKRSWRCRRTHGSNFNRPLRGAATVPWPQDDQN